jgi:hypothetical protein
MELPPIITNVPGLSAWSQYLRDYLRAITTRESVDIRPEEGVGGTSLRVKQAPALAQVAGASVASAVGIWQPYVPTDEVSDHPAWWRTVRITQGTVNAQHPGGDGSANYSDDTDANPVHNSIIIGGAAALAAPVTWHFYLKCTISTALDANEGKVTSVAIYAGTAWWTGYPDQPNGDSSTGAPPAYYYIPLYDITASADPAYTSGPYPAGTLALPGVWSKNDFWVDEVSFGNPACTTDGWITSKRMSLGPA